MPRPRVRVGVLLAAIAALAGAVFAVNRRAADQHARWERLAGRIDGIVGARTPIAPAAR